MTYPVSSVARFLTQAVVGRREAMPASLLVRFPELAALRLRRGGLLVRAAGWMIGRPTAEGITLWRTVCLAPGAKPDPALLLHELCHVRQFEADRWFPARYLWESLRRGYHRNRFEAEARQYTADVLTRRLATGD